MPDQLQLRGGTTTEHNSFTGAAREVTVDTTKKTLVVHDGSQAGGTPLMKESGTVDPTAITIGTGGTQRLAISNSEVVFNETGADVDFRIEGDSNANLFKVDAGNDRIGVGVATPANTFHVHGDGTLRISSAAGANQVESGRIRLTENITDFQGAYIHYDGNANKLHIGTHSGNTTDAANDIDCLTILRGGTSIGLGTDDPQTQIHAKKTGGCVIRLEDSTDNNYSHIFNTSDDLFISADRNGTGAGNLIFRNNGTNERMRIDSSGNLGIGTSNPATRLEVKDNSSGNLGTSIRLSQGYNSVFSEIASNFGGSMTLNAGQGTSTAVMHFQVNDTERMRLTNSGKLGIGETSPTEMVHIKAEDNTDVFGGLIIKSNNGTVSSKFGWRGVDSSDSFRVATAGTERMRVTSGGNLGIGYSSPTAKLDVFDSAINVGYGASGNTSGTFKLIQGYGYRIGAALYGNVGIYTTYTSNTNAGSLDFYTGSGGTNTAEAMRIDPYGRVIIGDNAVDKANGNFDDLIVGNADSSTGTHGITIVCGNAATNGGIAFSDGSNGGADAYRGMISYQHNDDHMQFRTNAAERMRITSTGAVGIGVSSPHGHFHVEKGTITEFNLWSSAGFGRSRFNLLARDTGSSGFFQLTTESTVPTEAKLMTVKNNGDVCLGTENSDSGGQAIGNNRGFVYLQSGHAIVRSGSTSVSGASGICYTAKFSDTGTGKAFRVMLAQTEIGSIGMGAGGTSFNTSSDYRRKENVVDLTNAIARLKTLLPKRFNFKDEPSVTRDGFLAHEVTAVPEAITGTKDAVDSDNKPVYQQLDQSKLVPLLVAAVKELITKVEALEAA